MSALFTAEMYMKHQDMLPGPYQARQHAADDNPDDPDVVVPETDELEDIDFEIVAELDTVHFNENLVIT